MLKHRSGRFSTYQLREVKEVQLARDCCRYRIYLSHGVTDARDSHLVLNRDQTTTFISRGRTLHTKFFDFLGHIAPISSICLPRRGRGSIPLKGNQQRQLLRPSRKSFQNDNVMSVIAPLGGKCREMWEPTGSAGPRQDLGSETSSMRDQAISCLALTVTLRCPHRPLLPSLR